MWQRCRRIRAGRSIDVATVLRTGARARRSERRRSGREDAGKRPGGRTRASGRAGHYRNMTEHTPSAKTFRVEHDSMGEVQVPADALWGAQTQRARANAMSGEPMPREVIIALARIKSAAAAVNAELGVIDADMSRAIEEAAIEVAVGEIGDGGHFDQFPLDVFQTGSGTSTNMNANEVIAALATRELGRPVHPNDHVNASQSSNDVFPSSIHLAATQAVVSS